MIPVKLSINIAAVAVRFQAYYQLQIRFLQLVEVLGGIPGLDQGFAARKGVLEFPENRRNHRMA